jgi:hypothetical protein
LIPRADLDTASLDGVGKFRFPSAAKEYCSMDE